MVLSLRARIEEIRGDPANTDILDLDSILREVGYEVSDYPEQNPTTRVYYHPEWGLLTFPAGARTVPVRRLLGIIDMICDKLIHQGRL